MQRLTFVVLCLALSSDMASAHPGHGSAAAQQGVWHYVTSPVHAWPILAIAALTAVGILRAIKRRSQR